MRRRLLDHIYKRTATGNPAVAKSVARRNPDISFPGFTMQDGTPSPDNPVDIVNVESPVQVEVTGGNLFDVNNFETYTNNGITLTVSKDEITLNGTATANAIFFSKNFYNELNNGIYTIKREKINLDTSVQLNLSSGLKGETSRGITFEKTDGVSFSYFIIRVYDGGVMDNVKIKFMLNKGETPLPWEPYKQPQTVTITSERPITKWDKLVKQNGVWGWLYQTAYIESYNGEEITGEWQSTTGELSTGATVQYKASPEFIPLSDEEQQLMNALHTNNPTTIVQNNIGTDVTLTYKTKRSLEVIQ